MIDVEKIGLVSLLRLAHGKVNALDLELLRELGERLEELERPDTRALVLTGAGSSFSAGVDLWRVLDGGKSYLDEFVPALAEVFRHLYTFPRPVVAAVNGHAIAGGCVLAMACDYRVMARGEGKIGAPELRVGVPFPAIAFEVVRSVVSPSLLTRLVYKGELLGPEEALGSGLLDETAEPDDLLSRSLSVAEELAAIPGDTFAITKRQRQQPVLDRSAGPGVPGPADVGGIWASAEVTAAVRAYMEKTVRRGR